MIELKTARELEWMKRAGQIVAQLLAHLAARVHPGIKTAELDEAARALIKQAGARPAFLGYRGFPASICVSINEEVVHGIPGERTVRDGDLVSLDVGVMVEGWYADAATTVLVGSVDPTARRLAEITQRALQEGITQARVGHRVSDISHAVQRTVEEAGFGIVREFVGHGIGRALHEDPPIPNFGPPHTGPRLKAGMALAIEPMVTLGSPEVQILDDGWTAVSKDRSLAAHFEHTIIVTDGGPEIITQRVHSPHARADST